MQIAAPPAVLGLAGENVLALPLAHRQDGLVDDVSRPLVVDEGAGAELCNGEETRPREKLIASAHESPSRNVGRQRQARETVAWEESLAGEVAIAVEVGLRGV